MKFTVKYAEVKNEKEQEVITESFNIKERRSEPYVMKSEILNAIKIAHPNIDAIVIRGCDVRVWNDD